MKPCSDIKPYLSKSVLALGLSAVMSVSYGADPVHGAIASTVRAFLLASAPEASDAQVDMAPLDSRLRLAPCSQALEASFAPGSRPLGQTSVAVRCAGDQPWTLYVPAALRVFKPVVVAKRELRRGATLGAQDLGLERREITALSGGYLTQLAEAVGKQAARPFGAGVAVAADGLTAPQLVKRNSAVTLRARVEGLEVLASGKSLTDGAEGDVIRVQNTKSQRIVEGKVMADGSVLVSM